MPTPPPAGPGAVRCNQIEMILTNDGRFGPYFGPSADVLRRDHSPAKTPQLCFDIVTALQAEGREVLQIKKEVLIQYAIDFVQKSHPEVAFKAVSKPASPRKTAAVVTPPAPTITASETPPNAPVVEPEASPAVPVVTSEAPAPLPTNPAPPVASKPKRDLKTPVVQPQAAAEVTSVPVASATTPVTPAPVPPVQPRQAAVAPTPTSEPRKLVDKIDVNLAIFTLIGSAFVLAERDTTGGANERRVKLAAFREEYLKLVTG